jgi:hypothetical protein
MIQVLNRLPDDSYQIERLRILDFYLLFPSTLKDVTFPRDAMRFKSVIPASPNPYEEVRDPNRIFTRIEPYQIAAIKYMAAHGLIDSEQLSTGKVRRTSISLPPGLIGTIDVATRKDKEILDLLTGPFRNIDLYGKSGLKARTNLFEFRYDPS